MSFDPLLRLGNFLGGLGAGKGWQWTQTLVCLTLKATPWPPSPSVLYRFWKVARSGLSALSAKGRSQVRVPFIYVLVFLVYQKYHYQAEGRDWLSLCQRERRHAILQLTSGVWCTSSLAQGLKNTNEAKPILK